MARLIEKQLRIADYFLDQGVTADGVKLSEEETKNLLEKSNLDAEINNYIPQIDISESILEARSCLSIKLPSIKISKSRFPEEVEMKNVIACPVNEFYSGNEYKNGTILIVEQDKYISTVIKYVDKFEVKGKLLFSIDALNTQIVQLDF